MQGAQIAKARITHRPMNGAKGVSTKDSWVAAPGKSFGASVLLAYSSRMPGCASSTSTSFDVVFANSPDVPILVL